MANSAEIREWNRQFALLNNIPDDKRANQDALMDYYKTITANNRTNGGKHFILPGEIKVPAVDTLPAPVIPIPAILDLSQARNMIVKIKADLDALYKIVQ